MAKVKKYGSYGLFDTVEVCNFVDEWCEKTKGFLVFCILDNSKKQIYDRVVLGFKGSQHASYMGSRIQILSCKMVLTEKFDKEKEILLENGVNIGEI